MNIKYITDTYSVSDQLWPHELATIAEYGIEHIVSFRPDHEDTAQPESISLQIEAERLGMKYTHIPIKGFSASLRDIAQFRTIFQSTDQPIHAFCKTGMRATWVWALSQRQSLNTEAIMEIAATAGYDLNKQRSLLEDLS